LSILDNARNIFCQKRFFAGSDITALVD